MEGEKTTMEELYSTIFINYPDVLNVEQLCEVLGGIGKKTVYKLLKEEKIKAFKVGREYRIPKLYVINYLSIGEDNSNE